MTNHTRRQGIDWVAVSIGCAVIVLLLAVLIALILVYTVVSSQPVEVEVAPPVAAVEVINAEDAPIVQLPPTLLPTQPSLAIVTATPIPTATPTETAVPPTLTPAPGQAGLRDIRGDIPPSIIQRPIEERQREDLLRMWELELPEYDYFAVAGQFGDDVGERVVATTPPLLGETREFWVDEQLVSAELVFISDNIYYWMQDDYVYPGNLLEQVTERIETEIYPGLVSLFGEEWKPGIDNDPHFSILHLTRVETFDEIGFFNSVNQYPRTLDESSNEQEIIFLNMGQIDFGSPLYYATVAHEIQHLIHWNLDRNETVWLNEGMSQLAEAYLGFLTSETTDYLDNPALQLNNWGYEGDVIYRHYAASYLFATYFWEQLGDQAMRDLSNSPMNGLASVRDILGNYRPDTTLEQFLSDWAVANLMDDRDLDDRYGYSTFRIAFPDKEERIRNFPWESVKLIPQYGVHYLDIRESGTYSLTFAADTTAPLLPSEPPSGERVWFAPSSSDVAATLTRPFDLTSLQSATLEFVAWYDLERDFDFAYVEVSTDRGNTWEMLVPDNYVPGIYGAALTGRSAALSQNVDGWISEAISLDEYVGQEILLRFEVLNDGAFSERGFALASIGIPEINYLSTADERPDDWEAAGFAVVGTELPQQWSLQLVQGQDVTLIELDELNRAEWSVSADSQGATLIVMPQTPWIRDVATYWLKVDQSAPVSPSR